MPYKIRTDEGFPSLGEVKKNFKVKWYRSPIDPAKLRKLMQRSDLQGGLQTFGHLGLFTVTGIATAYFFIHNQWVLFALSLWCHGTVGIFFRGIATHELGHGTVFKTKWLNGFFLRFFSIISFWNFHEYAMSHTYHHRYTLHPDGDREVLLPLEASLKPLLLIQLFTINVEGFFRLITESFRMATPHYNLKRTERGGTEWTEALFSLAPEVKEKSVRWARLTLVFHVAIVLISAITGIWWLSIVLTGYLFCGNWLLYLVGQPMHNGLRDNIPDFRLCVRSNKLDPLSSFLYWRMNWHTEHHMFAGVPCYNLKKLAYEIEDDMPKLRTLWQSWSEMIKAKQCRKEDPSYQFNTPLPATANPPVEHEHDVKLPVDDQVFVEASIGELAPSGQ